MMEDYLLEEQLSTTLAVDENTDVNIANNVILNKKASKKPENCKPTNIRELQCEVEALKEKLRLYEEAPNLDEQKLVVDGFKSVTSNYVGTTHIKYQITRTISGSKSLSVFRRFSDWVALYSLLVSELPGYLIPHPPPKKSLGSTDKEFVHKRSMQLHAYTKSLSRHPMVRQNHYFRKFLYLPNEQWEELTGCVTSVAILPHENRSLVSGMLDKTQAINFSTSSSISHLFKSIGESGKSFLSSLANGGAGGIDVVDIENLNETQRNFAKIYRNLTKVEVDIQTYYSFGMFSDRDSDSHSKNVRDSEKHTLSPNEHQNTKCKLRSKVFKKSADSVIDFISLSKSTSTCRRELSERLRALAVSETFSAGLAQDSSVDSLSHKLNAFAVGLENVSNAEIDCHKQMCAKKPSGCDYEDELIYTLYSNLFSLEGSTKLYESFEQCIEQNVDIDESLPEEALQCRDYIKQSLPYAMESFAEQQLELAAAKVKYFQDIYNLISREDIQ